MGMIIGIVISGIFICLLIDADERRNRAYLEYIKNHPDE